MSRQLFFDLLRTSAVVGTTALALVLVSPLWNRRFAARWKGWLWCVLAALLLAGPFLRLPEEAVLWTIPVPEAALMEREPGNREPVPAAPIIHPADIIAQNPDNTVPVQPVEHGAAAPVPALAEKAVDPLTLAELLWAAGAAVFALWQLGGELVFRRRVRRWAGPARSAELLALYRDTLPEVPHPPLLVCPGIGTPMLAGLLRPRLLLPREDYTASEAACILRHELTHLRRGDLWRKLLLLTANAVHWFNPAVWLLRREAEQDMERACDEQVVRGAAMEERRTYGAVLLTMAQAGNGPALSTHLSGSAKRLQKRLENILSADKRRGAAPAVLCALLAVCAVTLVACTGHSPEVSEPPRTETESPETCRILVLGTSYADGSYDTILLLTYDPAAPSLDVLSIPRDTYVESLPWDVKQIRTANLLEDGSSELSVQEIVLGLTGSTVDHTVRLDTAAVARLVDAVGGVACDVPHNMDYDDPCQDLSIHLAAGHRLLNGEQVMGLLRFRKSNDLAYSYDDLGRIATQQAVMRAMAEHLLSGVSLTELDELARLFRESAVTDLSLADLLNLGTSFLTSGLTAEDMTFRTLDGEAGVFWSEQYQANLSCWLPAASQDAPVSYAYDAAAENTVYLEAARQLLWDAFSFDAGGPGPAVETGPQLTLRYTVSQEPLDHYVVEFLPDSAYPATLYHFNHPTADDVDIAGDPSFEFDMELLAQARDFVERVYGVDCSGAEAHAYGYQNKFSVQLQAAENQIFHVCFYYESAEPSGILFFTRPEDAQQSMDANGARCFF